MRQAACVALAVLCVVRLGAQGISLNCTEASFADVAKLLQQAGGVTITGRTVVHDSGRTRTCGRMKTKGRPTCYVITRQFQEAETHDQG